METITTKDTFGNVHTYTVIEKMPRNYIIWNIGENIGTHNYIPIAEYLHPEDKKDFSIKEKSVKVIKVTEIEWVKLNNASSIGINNLTMAEKAIKSKRRGYWSDRKRNVAKETIEIFKRITL